MLSLSRSGGGWTRVSGVESQEVHDASITAVPAWLLDMHDTLRFNAGSKSNSIFRTCTFALF